jgi:5-methyltetrahydrofolate corrinoid/iron sulfur protein methyltransferase
MLVVADNFQITDPAICAAIDTMQAAPLQKRIRRYEAAGAQAIDVNMGPLGAHGSRKMVFCIEALQEVSSLPLYIDTVNSQAIEAALKICRNPVVINGFSLQPSKLETILPLAVTYDVDIIGYLLDPGGQVAADCQTRLALAIELYDCFQKSGLEPERLIVDPIVVPLIWQDGVKQAGEVLQTLRQLPDVLGFPVRTIAGLSNLTAGRGYREKRLLMEKAYLPMLSSAGLDMILMNINHSETIHLVHTCRVFTHPGIFTWEQI